MLKGLDPVLTADLLHVLMQMGHGDDIVVCDVNHPAVTIARETAHGRLLDLAGCDIPRATRAILSLMPLDTFVEAPVQRMAVVGDPERLVEVHRLMQATVDALEGRPVTIAPLERFAFYTAAKRAFAIVRTSDPGPYGCFILRKGVVDLPRGDTALLTPGDLAMRITRLDHSALIVRDLAATRHFYGEVLGLEEIPRPSSFKFGGCWFRGPDFELHFILERDTTAKAGFADPGPGGKLGLAHHLAFGVADLDATIAHLQRHGVALAAGPYQRGDGIVQVYVDDPDGNYLEFFARTQRPDIPEADRPAMRAD